MENHLFVIAAILIVAWSIGFIGFELGGYMHILLAFASVAIILRLEEPIFKA